MDNLQRYFSFKDQIKVSGLRAHVLIPKKKHIEIFQGWDDKTIAVLKGEKAFTLYEEAQKICELVGLCITDAVLVAFLLREKRIVW